MLKEDKEMKFGEISREQIFPWKTYIPVIALVIVMCGSWETQ